MNLNTLVTGNQSIKIVPSIEDSLRSTGFNVDLNEHSKTWLDHLKVTWKTWKNSATIENHLDSFFQSEREPYHKALAIIIKCDEFKDCKPKSLPYFIVETLGKWSTKCESTPPDYLKMPAFRIATHQRNQYFQTLVIKTYEISTIKTQILPIVRDMIAEGNYKQACHIVIATELSDDIPVEDLLFPLTLQDKGNIVDDYLVNCPNQVLQFLLFLDNLLNKNLNIHEYVQSYLETHKISDVKYDKLHYKPLGKLVARLCNKFKMPISTCQNLKKNRTTGGLRYLIYQKYQEHNVSLTVWDDLVKDALEQNSDTAIEFIDTLADYDKKEALKWAEYLKIPESSYPSILKESAESTDNVSENWDTEGKNWDESQQFYKLSIQRDQIRIIDSSETFYDMLTSNIASYGIIGIDCEWKPTFGTTQSQVALIQISTMNTVYLIDTLVLNKKEFSSFWCMFYKSLLDNAEIIKVGFGLEQDLKEIKASIIGLHNIKVKGEGLLDLPLLWKSLLNVGLTIPCNSDSCGVSLSAVVQCCFGLPLTKSEQCSNWELRPLRETQIQYAALDAYVLMEIYLYLQRLAGEQGLNFEEICNDVMVDGKQKNPKKLKTADRLKSSLTMEKKPLKQVDEVKFLVDPPLSGLLSCLRYVGIDTDLIKSEMLWHDVIHLATSEDRLILLKKLKLTPMTTYPQSSILEVKGENIPEKLYKVFSHFNIDITEDKLSKSFSRCIHCNNTELRILSINDIIDIKERSKGETDKQCKHKNYHEEDDDDFINGFLSDSDCDNDINLPEYKTITKLITNCLTKKGVPITYDEIDDNGKDAVLCESCGKIFWNNEDIRKSIKDVFNKGKLSSKT